VRFDRAKEWQRQWQRSGSRNDRSMLNASPDPASAQRARATKILPYSPPIGLEGTILKKNDVGKPPARCHNTGH
jgi:hypothetical protein